MKKISCLLLCVILLFCITSCTGNHTVMKQKDSFMIGSTVVFGSYEQDNNYMNGQESIEWIILDQEEDRVLLLSKYVLDYLPYHSEWSKVKWEDSAIREWLNVEFKADAFDATEQMGICPVTNVNCNNSQHNTSGGNDTNDEIFLLSIEEYNKYLLNNINAEGIETVWERNKVIETNDRAKNSESWWLRTPGKSHDRGVYVYDAGEIAIDGSNVSLPNGVRPSLWVKSSYLTDASSNTNSNEPNNNDFSSVNRGDYVFFGKYEQDGNSSNGMEDVEWLVLSKDENKILLISKYCIDGMPYNTEYAEITWENCTLRTWLNNNFYENTFDPNEKSLIISNTVVNDRNREYPNNPSGNNTVDKIFLLSTGEAEMYFNTNEERKTTATVYAQSEKDVFVDQNGCWWWLRSPGGYVQGAASIWSDGSINYNGGSVNNGIKGNAFGVRPAMWVMVQ